MTKPKNLYPPFKNIRTQVFHLTVERNSLIIYRKEKHFEQMLYRNLKKYLMLQCKCYRFRDS